jgi:cytochrome P450
MRARQSRDRERKGDIPEHTILGHLLRIPDINDPSKNLSDGDLAAQIAMFFVAGVDTTGHTIAWTL